MDMLGLGGEILLSGGITTGPASDEARLSVMKQARQTLTQRSGRDFGFDLAAWHHFLQGDVKPRIDELLGAPDRLRLERLLNEHPEAAPDKR
jgi:hypothetical protein